MTRLLLRPAIAAVFSIAVSAQPADEPRFEAADVHVSAPSSNIRNNFMQGPFVGGGRFEIRRATILDLIRLGWVVQPDKIVGGPVWAGLERFDILAKAPAKATSADLRVMLQNLLADRFSLKVHKDMKPMPAFAIVQIHGKKPHLKESSGNGAPGCKPQSSGSGEGRGQLMFSGPDGVVNTIAISPGNLITYNCRNVTMAAFASAMQGFLART